MLHFVLCYKFDNILILVNHNVHGMVSDNTCHLPGRWRLKMILYDVDQLWNSQQDYRLGSRCCYPAKVKIHVKPYLVNGSFMLFWVVELHEIFC